MHRISSDKFEQIQNQIMDAKYSIRQYDVADKDILIYMPDYIKQYMFRYYQSGMQLTHVSEIDKAMIYGIKIVTGYENAIIVAHTDAALRDIPVYKITLNEK